MVGGERIWPVQARHEGQAGRGVEGVPEAQARCPGRGLVTVRSPEACWGCEGLKTSVWVALGEGYRPEGHR